jgi:hypothetical protein
VSEESPVDALLCRAKQKSSAGLWGESLREIGVLLLVFVPVDGIIQSGTRDVNFWWRVPVAVIGGLILIWRGIKLECGD